MSISSTPLKSTKLLLSILLVCLCSYIFLVYYFQIRFTFSYSDLDNLLYRHFLQPHFVALQNIIVSPISFIVSMIILLGLLYAILKDFASNNKNIAIYPLLGFMILMLVLIHYISVWSSFWISNIIVLWVMYLLCVRQQFLPFGMFLVACLLGTAVLFYQGHILFLLLLIVYSVTQKKALNYIFINIFGIITPMYALWAYMWIVDDRIIHFPYIFSNFSMHTHIFGNIYIMMVIVSISIAGYVYLWVRQLGLLDVLKKQARIINAYYLCLLIIFFIEQNDTIALSTLVLAISLLFIKLK